MYKKAFELSYKNKKVEIEIQDFTGTVRNINGTEDLFSLSYISDSKDKGQSILVTEADINFYADDYFNIDELKTVGETDIKVKYYEDGILLWSGFVIPDFFSTSVDITPVVSMVATDRIGTLKEISNNAESNIPIQILASCLKQTGQDLPINLIADNNHFETPIQLERIEEIASYDVIRTFMVLFNCKITLYKNAWWIINKKLLESGFINYKSYNSNGVGGSVTPFAQPILDIDLVDRDGQREIKPTASEISLFLEFGGSKKYPKNWNFEKWSINPQAPSTAIFDDWDIKGVFYPYPFDDLLPIANNNPVVGYDISGNSLVATKDTSINYDSYNLQLRTSTQQGSGTDQSKMSYRHLESSYSKVVFLDGRTEIKVSINFTNPSGEFINVTPVIRTKNSNGTLKRYFAIDNDKSVKKAGEASINLFGVEPIRVEATQSETKIAVQTKWENIFITDDSTLGLIEGDTADVMLIIWGDRFYPLGAPNIKSYIDTFIHSANISFNDYEVTGKGLIFKIKQGGEKFSKSREPETILFSDKINQGINGHFYNYKYDDTSIVDLPSEFALSSVRERADMFSKARDYYSLDGNFIVNPLAKYVCGLKSFVLIGGQNRREDAGIIVEEIVSNTLNRTDFIYTYFDDGKDKVKSIGTASGGSISGGGGGGVSSPQLWKVDEEGNIYTEYNAYSLKNLSAFGFEEEQGGGVIINVIDNLTSTSKTDPLSANMGRYLKTLIDNIEVGEGGQVIVDWEAITGRPTTFAPSAHTHIIGDVAGLQGALDGKASLSQLDDKEDKFTKNSAFNKNFGTGLNDVARGNHTHTFASLTSIPTTLSGYGITDGASKVHTHAISDVTDLETALNSKQATLTQGSNITIVNNVISAVDTTYGIATTLTNGLMSSTDKSKLDGIAKNANNYSLPTASDTVLGGIKVGSRLSIASGVLSATQQTANDFTTAYKNKLDGIESNANNYSLPTASDTVIGGVKVGARLTITSGTLSADSQTENNFTTVLKNKLDGIESGANKYTHPSYTARVSGLYKVTVDNLGHISGATAVVKSDITGLGIPAQDTTYSAGSGISLSSTIFSVAGGYGLVQETSGLKLGTPSTLTASTTNEATDTSHTHAITTTSVGAANTIIQTDASGGTKLGNLTIGDWSLLTEYSDAYFTIKYGGANKMRISTAGSGAVEFNNNLFTDGDITAEGSILAYDDVTAHELIADSTVTTPKVNFGNGWTAEGVGAELQFKLNGVIQAKIVNGALVSTGEVTAFY